MRRFFVLFLLLLSAAAVNARPHVQEEESNPLVPGNNGLAFSLYHAVRQESGGNLVFSPYSIFQALGLLYTGAGGTTQQQMAEVLALPENVDQAFLNLAAQVNAPPDYEGIVFQLNVSNALWPQQGITLKEDYVTRLADYYGALLQSVDYAAPEAAAEQINTAISEQTNGRITNLIDPSTLNPQTRLILTNAIYLNAAWALMFDESETVDGAFTLLDGSQVTVPVMHMQNQFFYAGTEDFLALQLDFQQQNFGMLVILPDEGKFEEVESGLDAAFFDAIQSQLFNPYKIILSLPRFKYDTSLDLADTLAALGMPEVFSNAADFSGISDDPLFVDAVTHQAFIQVDEKGTEAAAATALGLGGGGPPNAPIEFNVNRPFIYLIYHQSYDAEFRGEGGTILFIGRVINPAE